MRTSFLLEPIAPKCFFSLPQSPLLCAMENNFLVRPLLFFYTWTFCVLTLPSFKSKHFIYYSIVHPPIHSIYQVLVYFWLLQEECPLTEGRCFSWRSLTLYPTFVEQCLCCDILNGNVWCKGLSVTRFEAL